MRSSLPSSFAKIVLCTLIAILAVSAAFAGVSGAIYTTNSDGTTVNGNIYPSKDAVYLSGGPQNQNAAGLSPDGLYYFQVTDPSGAVLLSTDDVTCRQVVVLSGRVDGIPAGAPPASCTTGYHANGTANDANGALPVQLIPYNDTPNNGGVYKAWMTPVADYGEACAPNHASYGFCDRDSKTDNFKIRAAGSTTAFVTVCKFNDQNDDSIQQSTEPQIPHWPITATGVDGGTVATQTDDNGCVSFSVSGIQTGQTQQVTLTEGTQGPDWTQTAPTDGPCTLTGTVNVADTCTVSGGVITLTLSPSDDANAPNFGNFNPNCTTGCTGNQVIVTKDANPIVTYTWKITKKVDRTEIDTAPGGNTTFNYTVDVSHDSGTATMTGTIRVSNATDADINNVTVSDAVSDVADGGVCTVEAGPFASGTGTVLAGDHVDVHYSCTFTQVPAAGANTNTATASWDSTFAVGTAGFDFGAATIVDGSVTVTDPLAPTNPLGTASYTQTNPIEFTYSNTVTGTPGTCVTQNNTATFTTNTTGTTGSDNKSVKVCEGKDLTVSKDANPTFKRTYNWTISKAVDKTLVEQLGGGTATFNYTVNASETGFTDSAWAVGGTITVSNPNDWEPITVTGVSDALSTGGTCTVTPVAGNNGTIAASGSAQWTYSCTAPSGTSGTNTATATWSGGSTPNTSASNTPVPFAFTTPTTTVNKTVTITDTFNGVTTTLGTLTATDSAPFASGTYKYSHTVNVPTSNCVKYTNTAAITETGQHDSKTIEVCGPAKTGALTMGFWQNKNGQSIITGGASTGGVCNSGAWLRTYNPFMDLSATANCSAVATYVFNLIKAANASGATMNAMLKAQDLATSLDVYFSNPALGGNKIGAPAPVGGVTIDLTKICKMIDNSGGTGTCSGSFENTSAAFGGASSGTVSFLIGYAATQSNAGGSLWYGQVKATQGLAKDTFDAINNGVAFAP